MKKRTKQGASCKMKSIIFLWIILFFRKNNHVLKWCFFIQKEQKFSCGHVSLSKKNKSNYPLLPNLSLPKNFFQITLNKDHPPTEGWHNVCFCFIRLVVHQYKNIKKKERKKWHDYIEKKKENEMKSNKY